MVRRTVRPVLALCAVSLSLAVAGCGSSAAPAATTAAGAQAAAGGSLAGQSLTVYSGQHQQTVQVLVKDFESRTGVKVQLRSGDEAELANQILQEGKASPADVFYAENPPALTNLEERGLLAPVDTKTLQTVSANDSSAKSDWVGVSARTAAFVFNTDKMSASSAPSSVRDLAGAAWKGKLGIAPSETDFAPIITRMIASDGQAAAKQWLEGLKANAKVYNSNEDLVAAVNRGEVAGGVIDHYYWYRLRDEQGAGNIHSALHYFTPGDPGALVDVSGVAVLSASKHQSAAQAWLAYLTSTPAQTIIATSQSYEYPLAAGVQNTKVSQPLAQVGTMASPGELGDGKQALQLLQDAGLL